MRVLSIGNMYPPHDLRGGYELMWVAALDELRRRGHDVMVLTTDYRASDVAGRPEERDIRRELHWYWEDHRFPRRGIRRTIRLERHNQRTLDATVEEFAPDVVVWFAMGGMSLALIERVRRRNIHAIGFVHDDWMLYGPRVDKWQRLASRTGRFGGLLERLTGTPVALDFARAALWVFVSRTCRDRAAETHGALRKAAILHSGIDTRLFQPNDPRPWRGELLYVGRIDHRKGVETVLRALRPLPGARLTLVGTGDPAYLADLRALAQRLDLATRVSHRSAARAELPSLYANADAVIFPVHWQEPWGLVPLEAMAVGRPVVASGQGGSGEYLRDGENCILYGPPDDHEALARSILRIRRDEDLRARIRSGGFATARLHTESAFAQKAADLITARGGSSPVAPV